MLRHKYYINIHSNITMKRLIQRVDYTTVLSYDGSGFENIPGEMRYNSDDKPHIYFDFYVTNSAEVYLSKDDGDFVDDFLVCTTEVSIFEDSIEVHYPYVPTRNWLHATTMNIVDYLNNYVSDFSYDIDKSEIGNNKSEFRLNIPHPYLNSYDIIKLFNNSLYNFDKDVYSVDKLQEIGVSSEESVELYILKETFGNEVGIYYIPDYDLFHFNGEIKKITDEDVYDIFDDMIFKLLYIESPIQHIKKLDNKIIDINILVPWLYWYGYPAVELWNYIKDYLFLEEDEVYNRIECFNYVKERVSNVSVLELRRIESDLLDLLYYEYPIESINKNDFIKKVESKNDKNISIILWEENLEFKEDIDKYVDKNTPHTAFSYGQDVGYKGDILYYELSNEPIKLAVQLKRYQAVIPTSKNLRFESAKEITPFGWYAKVIGVKLLDDNLSEKTVKSIIKPDKHYLMYNSAFTNASQLLYKELYTELDIIFNKPDTSVWD